ncbi:unnamed protein product [Paramecium octaurelia]|uniref:Transmembrane protein n=1 Tax=Paramecium octaurelia TaxID=43137 RepID=A0A8S1YNI2_PAROT|nr:unnamed protein product [Paramecium octaurelia]
MRFWIILKKQRRNFRFKQILLLNGIIYFQNSKLINSILKQLFMIIIKMMSNLMKHKLKSLVSQLLIQINLWQYFVKFIKLLENGNTKFSICQLQG